MHQIPGNPTGFGDALDAPFWEGCARGEFLVHRCEVCGLRQWPASTCPDHGADNMAWVPASGRGTVYTYTVFHRAYAPHLADRVPYVIAVVALDEGPFFHTDVVGCAVGDVHVGMRVEAEFTPLPHAPDVPVPRFHPS